MLAAVSCLRTSTLAGRLVLEGLDARLQLVLRVLHIRLGRDALGERRLQRLGRGPRLLGREAAAGEAVDIGERVEKHLRGHGVDIARARAFRRGPALTSRAPPCITGETPIFRAGPPPAMRPDCP